jgi:hypothetical protein
LYSIIDSDVKVDIVSWEFYRGWTGRKHLESTESQNREGFGAIYLDKLLCKKG